MTIASTAQADCRQPVGVDRLAQRLGLALVAWSERSLHRPEVSRADHRLQRQAAQLLSDHADLRATASRRPF